MDWRKRKYYCITFDWRSIHMRTEILKVITDEKVKFHYNYYVDPQPDELENRGTYIYMISVPKEYSEAVEYELRKAERNDDYCYWREVEQQKSY